MTMTGEQHTIPPQCGIGFTLRQSQTLKVIDVAGQQVADLFAFAQASLTEWLSNGRTFDYNNTLALTVGHTLYSNDSHPMLTILEDTVGRHQFLYSPCSQAMFEIQYGSTAPHPNCLDNLVTSLASYGVQTHMITTPFNCFMNASIAPDGSLSVEPPISNPGDYLLFRAEMDLIVAVTACSAGACNNFKHTPIQVEID